MNEHPQPADPTASEVGQDGRRLEPLPGEAGIPDVAVRRAASTSKKGLFAIAFLGVTLIVVAAISVQRVMPGSRKTDDAQTKLASDRPAAATTEPRRLDMTPPPAPASAATPRIPALIPTPAEIAEPIGVRRTGQGAPTTGGPKTPAPEDAPVLLVSTRPGGALAGERGLKASSPSALSPSGTAQAADSDENEPLQATTRNLQNYQRQLQGLLDTLTRSPAMATGQASGATPTSGTPIGRPSFGPPPNGAGASQGAGLFGGQLQGSTTPRTSASTLVNRSITMPKGTSFTCALKTRIISATSGLVGCMVQRNVYGDDGRVLLVERGSHLDGEYRITSVKPGTVRIPVIWTRIRTPNGVTVDIDSPGTGPLGESGVDGYVDNRWSERIGAAMLLSLIDDSVKMIIQSQASDGGDTLVLPSTTTSGSKLAEKVLDSTINIPPLIYRNQGDIVGINVARDVDFSSVYELQPVAR